MDLHVSSGAAPGLQALSNLWLERDRSYKLLHASGAPPQPADARRLATQFQELRQALSIFLDEETQAGEQLGTAGCG